MNTPPSLAAPEPLRSEELVLPPARVIEEKPSFIQQIFQCVIVAGLATVSFFLISHYVIQSVRVDGESMAPTLHNSDRYLLNHLTYWVRPPKPEDIVVLKDPEGGFAVKRIIAGPGDSVYFKGGWVYVNGRKLVEPYLEPGTPTYADWKRGEELIRCGPNQYFVMGDNRQRSADSRTYGSIPRKSVLGAIIRH